MFKKIISLIDVDVILQNGWSFDRRLTMNKLMKEIFWDQQEYADSIEYWYFIINP